MLRMAVTGIPPPNTHTYTPVRHAPYVGWAPPEDPPHPLTHTCQARSVSRLAAGQGMLPVPPVVPSHSQSAPCPGGAGAGGHCGSREVGLPLMSGGTGCTACVRCGCAAYVHATLTQRRCGTLDCPTRLQGGWQGSMVEGVGFRGVASCRGGGLV